MDRFIIVESPTTFTNKPKPWYYEEQKDRFKRFAGKITYFQNLENYQPDEVKLAENSPNTQGASHWKHEFLQKERIKWALLDLDDNDTVFIGDVDEIWNPDEVDFKPNEVEKHKLRVYTYYLNNRSTEDFWGFISAPYEAIKDECLNHIRTNAKRKNIVSGYHFTSMADGLQKKLTDQYTEESYATRDVIVNIPLNIENNKDFLGRQFEYRIDETELPKYILDNRERYRHLLK